ncbi:MAG: hypothetical protein R2710_12055 [Acidimicrobiales bacterium]
MSSNDDHFALDGSIAFAEVPADQVHRCPRCDTEVTERFYGPCTSCRAELRASQGNEQIERVSAEYEPKMNVTPNAVALKDD